MRIAAAVLEAEHDHAQADGHLRRGQADSAGLLHGLPHVLGQVAQLAGAHVLHRLGRAHQHRLAHSHDLADHRILSRARVPGPTIAQAGAAVQSSTSMNALTDNRPASGSGGGTLRLSMVAECRQLRG